MDRSNQATTEKDFIKILNVELPKNASTCDLFNRCTYTLHLLVDTSN